MSSNRITVAMKEHIAKEEASAKFDSAIKEANDKMIKLLEDRVQSIVNGRMKVTDEMLASGYIATTNYARYKCEDKKGTYEHYTLFSLSRSYPRKFTQDSFNIQNEPEIDMQRKVYADLKDEKKKFQSKVEQVLRAYTVKTKLVEDIPEFRIYFKNDLNISKALIPMSQIMDLRKTLTSFDITKKEKNDGQEKIQNQQSGQPDRKARGRKVAS